MWRKNPVAGQTVNGTAPETQLGHSFLDLVSMELVVVVEPISLCRVQDIRTLAERKVAPSSEVFGLANR
jgi:hypothetical protein